MASQAGLSWLSILYNHSQGLSHVLETGCPKLAILNMIAGNPSCWCILNPDAVHFGILQLRVLRNIYAGEERVDPVA